jgi:hypothetical protein
VFTTPSMKKIVAILLLISAYQISAAQKIVSIHFNPYTDSVKKGFFYYISVDAKLDNGKWKPLSENEVTITASNGTLDGSNLFVPKTCMDTSIAIKIILKKDTSVFLNVVAPIRKRIEEEKLTTTEEVINGKPAPANTSKKKKRRRK